jgi:hypothetical protein
MINDFKEQKKKLKKQKTIGEYGFSLGGNGRSYKRDTIVFVSTGKNR